MRKNKKIRAFRTSCNGYKEFPSIEEFSDYIDSIDKKIEIENIKCTKEFVEIYIKDDFEE